MSSFTEKIFNQFRLQVGPQIQSQNEAILPEERWAFGSAQNDTLLNLALQSKEIESIEHQKQNVGTLDPRNFFSAFEHDLDHGKKMPKTSSSFKHDKDALEFIGFQSSEQNLKTLLSLDRQSIQRGVIHSHLDDGDTKKRLLLLLMHLSETDYYNNQTVNPSLVKLSASFSDEILPISSALRRVRNEILTLPQNDKIIERYLRESSECQEIYNFQAKTCITNEQMQLDLVCRTIAESSNSAQVMVYLANLTGNVTYLIRAIKLLLKYKNQFLRPEQVNFPSIRCAQNLKRAADNKVLVQKQKVQLSEGDRVLKLSKDGLQIFFNNQTRMIEVKNQLERVQEIRSFRYNVNDETDKLGMCCFSLTENKNERLRYIFVYYINQVHGKIDFECKLLDTQKCEWSSLTETLWPQHLTSLVKSLGLTKKIEAIIPWGSEIGKKLVTFSLHENLVKENEENQTSSSLVTCDIQNKGQWTQNFDCLVCGFEIIEKHRTAVVILQKPEGEFVVIKDLLSGTYSKSLSVGSGDSFQVEVQQFIQDQEIGKDLPKNRPKRQKNLKGHWWWIIEGKKLVFYFDNPNCRWSDDYEGTYLFDESTLLVKIMRNGQEATYQLSGNSYTLTATEEIQGWPRNLERCVAQSKPREPGTFIQMNEFILKKQNVGVTCQFDVRGGGTGREFAENLIKPEANDWCKWYAGNCFESQSWVLIDMNQDIEVDGFGFTSANDCDDRDPQFAEIHYMQSDGSWVYLGAVKLTFNRRFETITFGLQAGIRTKAIIVNLGKYQDAPSRYELQLGQIKLLQDPSRFKIEFEQISTYEKLEVINLASSDESLFGSNWVLNHKNGAGFSIAVQKYPLPDQTQSEAKDQRLEENAAEYFGVIHEGQATQNINSLEWALYLAKLIDLHSKLRQEKVPEQAKLRWLHKQPSKFYFQEVAELFADESTCSPILEYLSQNVADNLNECAIQDLHDLRQLLESKTLSAMIRRHSEIQPSIINYYRKACPSLPQSAKEFIGALGLTDLKVAQNFKFQAICEQILNTGDLTSFSQTWEEMAKKRLHQNQLGLLLAVSNAVDRLGTVLSFEMITYLIDVSVNTSLNPVLVREAKRLILKVVANQFFKHQNLSKHSTYDHKGYLVTQSELLTGGINDKHIDVFKNETHLYLQGCANLIGDTSLQRQISKILGEELKESSIINTVKDEDKGIHFAIIHTGQNQMVDEICSVFQTALVSKGGLIAKQSQAGQDSGMRLTRAAFACMIKLLHKAQAQFQELLDELDLMNGEDIPLELGAERDSAIQDICIRSSHFQDLLKLWINATKMRSWLTAKIKSVSQKYQNLPAEQSHENETTHLQQIYDQITEKAELLIKIDPPKQPVKAEIQIGQLQRTPSYIQPKFATIQTKEQLETQDDATKKEQTSEPSDACVASVLACLQTPVLAIEIQNQIENCYLEAIKRFTGLTLLSKFLAETTEEQKESAVQVVHVLQMLQKKDGKLSHYLDGISGGCNSVLEAKIRNVFFEILEKLANKLSTTEDQEEAYTLVYSFQWGYHARDFDSLRQRIDIFNTLTRGKSPTSQISKTWCKFDSPHPTLTNDLLLSFKDIFMTVLARVSDPASDFKTQLKIFGNENLVQAVPKLVKVRSQLDENSSSLLIDSALRVIFRYFDSFCAQKQKLKQLVITEKLKDEIAEIHLNELFLEDSNISHAMAVVAKILNTEHEGQTSQEAVKPKNDDDETFLLLANIEVQIDTTKQEISYDEKGIVGEASLNSSSGEDKIKETRDCLLQAYDAGSESQFIVHLLDCIQMMTSVSKQSASTAKLLKSVASPYYVRTLLQLIVNLSQTMKFRVLQLIDDLVSIDVQLVEFNDEIQKDSSQIYDSSTANFLYTFARQCIQEQTDFMIVKTVVKILRKLGIGEKHKIRIEKLQELDACDQVLSLMICNCQAELESCQPGDLVRVTTNDLPIEHNFILMRSSQTCQLFCPSTGKSQSKHRQHLKLVHSGEPLCYPDQKTVEDMILSENTIPVVKAILINLVLRNIDRYQSIILTLVDYIQKYLVEDYLAQRKRESQQWDSTVCVFLTEEIEDQAFLKIYKELKKQPAKVFSETNKVEKSTSRNLIRTFFRPKAKKDEKYHNTVEELAYYDLFQVRDTVFHLIENPHFKQDMLKKLTSDKLVYPVLYEKHSRSVIKDRVARIRQIFKSWGDQKKIKSSLQKSEPLKYKTKFSSNFKYILSHETKTSKLDRKNQAVPIKNCDSENLIYQRMSELLFATYQSPTLVVDDEILWHLNRFFMQKSAYLFMRNLSARQLSKRWFEIVNTCDSNWINLYIRRSIRHAYSDSEILWDQEKDRAFFYILQRPLRIVYKLIVSRYEELAAEFLPDFCEVILRQMVATKISSSSHFKANRKNIHMVQSLITLVQEKNDGKLFEALINNTMLQEFTKQACKQKPPLFQFSYVGRLIQSQLVKLHTQFKENGLISTDMEKIENDNLSLLISEYERIVSSKDLGLLAQMSESQQNLPVFETFVELRSENFGQWQQVKFEAPDSELDEATLQVVALEGTGFSLIAISDEPQINRNTRYRVVQAGNRTDFVSIKVEAKKAAFLLYPVDRAFVLKFQQFNVDFKFTQDNQFELDQNESQIYAFTGLIAESENKSWLFATTKQKLYFAVENNLFQEVKGILGTTTSVKQIVNEHDEYFVIQTDQNIIYRLNADDLLKKQKKQRQSFFHQKESNSKVMLTVTSVQQNENIHTFQAITPSNEVISLIAETVFEQSVSVTVLRDAHEAVTIACEWTNEKKKALKGDKIYLQVEKKKEPFHAKPMYKIEKLYKQKKDIQFVTFISNNTKELIAIVVDGYFDLWTNMLADGPKIHAKLPDEVEKVTQVHMATTSYSTFTQDWDDVAFFIQTTTKDDAQTRLYWGKPDPDLLENTSEVSLEFSPTKEQNFLSICSAFGRVLAIDTEGEIWCFYDKSFWFSQNDGQDLDENPLVKTTLMKQRLSKAVELSLRLHIRDFKNANDCPREDPSHVMLIARRQRVVTETKTEESFECIPQRNWDDASAWATKVTFNLNQMYYRENQYIEQSNNKVMSIVSESMNLGYQFYLVKQNNQNVAALKYKIFDPNTPSKLDKNYTDEEIANCKEFLNNLLKKERTQTVLRGIMNKKKSLSTYLKEANFNTEGHSQQLVQILITANQFLFDSLPVSRAKAHDEKYSQMSDFVAFAEKYALPSVIQLLILYIQKTILPVSRYFEHKVRFQRLNSTEKLFDQLYRQTSKMSTKLYTFRQDPERPFRSRFIGENAYDAGGPFRDVMDDICAELTESFFMPTSNMAVTGDSSYQPKKLTDLESMEKFQYIGKMIGWSLRQWNYNLSLDMNPLFWKRICGQPIQIEDLKEVDKYRYQFLDQIRKGNFSGTFEVDLGTGNEIPLCKDGEKLEVTAENSNLFIQLYLEKYLEQDQAIHDAIRSGVEAVCPKQILRHLTVQAASFVAFSTPKVSAEELLSRVQCDNSFTFDITRKLFDRMVREFSNKERQLLLKFITGSSRLTSQGHTVYLNVCGSNQEWPLEDLLENPSLNEAHRQYPVGHTCGKSVDLPDYTDYDIMCLRFRTAILTCGEIDDDGNYYDSEEDRGEGEGESDDGEGSSDDQGEGESDGESQGEAESESDESGSAGSQSESNERSSRSGRQSDQISDYQSRNSSNRSQDDPFYGGLRFDSGSDNDSYGENEESEEYGNESSDSPSGSERQSQSSGGESSNNEESDESEKSGNDSQDSYSEDNEDEKAEQEDDDDSNQSKEKSNPDEQQSWASDGDEEEVDY